MSSRPRYQAEPCPMCDKPDAARMSSTQWGHNEPCCSEECGVAYATSVKQAERNVERMRRGVALAQERLAEWEQALAHRLELAKLEGLVRL